MVFQCLFLWIGVPPFLVPLLVLPMPRLLLSLLPPQDGAAASAPSPLVPAPASDCKLQNWFEAYVRYLSGLSDAPPGPMPTSESLPAAFATIVILPLSWMGAHQYLTQALLQLLVVFLVTQPKKVHGYTWSSQLGTSWNPLLCSGTRQPSGHQATTQCMSLSPCRFDLHQCLQCLPTFQEWVQGVMSTLLLCAGYSNASTMVVSEFLGAAVIGGQAIHGVSRSDVIVAFVEAPTTDPLLHLLPESFYVEGNRVYLAVEGRNHAKDQGFVPYPPAPPPPARQPSRPPSECGNPMQVDPPILRPPAPTPPPEATRAPAIVAAGPATTLLPIWPRDIPLPASRYNPDCPPWQTPPQGGPAHRSMCHTGELASP
jgi:hypothetical protein